MNITLTIERNDDPETFPRFIVTDNLTIRHGAGDSVAEAVYSWIDHVDNLARDLERHGRENIAPTLLAECDVAVTIITAIGRSHDEAGQGEGG